MIASNVSREALERAARDVGVRAEITPANARGDRFRVKLYPLVPSEAYTPAGHRRKGERGNARWQRTSASYFSRGRRVHAVCWHGFRAFFRAVYACEPEAVFRTACATYKGAEQFERVHPETGDRNIGPQIAPIRMQDACECSL